MKIRSMLLIGCLLVILCASFIFASVDKTTEANSDESFANFMIDLELEINSFEGQKLPGTLSPFISDETLEVLLRLKRSNL